MSRALRSAQEQAIAAWVTLINQQRIDTLLSSLTLQDVRLQNALQHLQEAMETINEFVIERNLGGLKGMHGFIAEAAEVGVSNARATIRGKAAVSRWVNDNGPTDILRSGVEIQQKFVAAGGTFSLQAIVHHLGKYPDYIARGGTYQVPSDFYASLRQLHAMSQEEATRTLSGAGDSPTFAQWKRVQALFAQSGISIDSIEPSNLEYAQVQRGAIVNTLSAEADALAGIDEGLRTKAYQLSLPSVREAARVSAVAAAAEGATAFALAVVQKRRGGVKLADFTWNDWREIAGESSRGAAKGGVRGVSLYALTNFTATSAAVASSLVTVGFGIAEQAHQLRVGEITELEFIENAEYLAIDSAVSALSAFIGQAVIPIPVLGAVIGNAVGMIMYRCSRDVLSQREVTLIEQYAADQRALDERLASEFEEVIAQLGWGFSSYLAVLDRAFAPDPESALLGSVELAQKLGVPMEQILDSDEKISSYFLD